MWFWRIAKGMPYLVLGAVMWGAQVKPEDAASNLSAWLSFLGLEHVPFFVERKAADQWTFWIAFVVLVCYSTGLFLWHQNKLRRVPIAKERKRISRMPMVTGTILNELGKQFVAGGEAMNKALDQGRVTPEQYKVWAGFATYFKVIYQAATDIWKNAVKEHNKRTERS